MNAEVMTLAARLRATGATWSAILSDLQARGASRLDLVRAVRDIDGLSVGEATKIVDEFGITPSAGFEVTVDEDDPFYGRLFSDEYRGQPDDDH